MLTLATLFLCWSQAAPVPELVGDLSTGPAPLLRVDSLQATLQGRLWVTGSDPGTPGGFIGSESHAAWRVEPGGSLPAILGPLQVPGGLPMRIRHAVQLGPSRILCTASGAGSDELWALDPDGSAPVQLIALFDDSGFVDAVSSGGFGYALTAGRRLVVSDGTPAGTAVLETLPSGLFGVVVVRDLAGNSLHPTPNGVLFVTKAPFGQVEFRRITNPFTPSSTYFTLPQSSIDLQHWTSTDERLFFARDEPGVGAEPWSSDGTAAGTVRLADLEPGSAGSGPQFGAAHGTDIYFTAATSGAGREVWFSDGTPGGTRLFAEPNPGPSGSAVEPQWIAPLSTGALFFAESAGAGLEPWLSDGTAAGTQLFADLTPGPAGTPPMGGLRASDPLVALLLPTGDTAGRPLVVNVSSGTLGLFPDDARTAPSAGFEFLGSRAYTSTSTPGDNSQLWESDGTAAGTGRVIDGVATHASASSSLLFPLAGTAPFTNPPEDGPTGLQRSLFFDQEGDSFSLWSTDGTSAQLVDSGPFEWLLLLPFGQRFVFVKSDGTGGGAPWITDGTPGGTALLAPLQAGNNFVAKAPFGGGQVGQRLLFSAFDPTTGLEVWTTDGTPAGTSLLVDAQPGLGGSEPRFGPLLDGRRLFATEFEVPGPAGPEQRGRLWSTDGTAAGTASIADLPWPIEQFSPLVAGFVYLSDGPSFAQTELWRTDGTTAGTEPGSAFVVGAVGAVPAGNLARAGDRLIIVKGMSVRALSPSGLLQTVLNGEDMKLLTRAGPVVYVAESSTAPFLRIWRTDGTGSPQLVLDDLPTNLFTVATVGLHSVGSDGTAIGVRSTIERGAEPFLIDGSTGQLVDLSEVRPGPHGTPTGFTARRRGATLLVALDDGVVGQELFAYSVADLGSYVAEPYGSGCGLIGSPTLAFEGEARLGAAVSVHLSQASPNAPAFLLIADAPASVPIGSCVLALDGVLPLVTSTTDATGVAAWPFQLSTNPYWLGAGLYLQAATVVPGGPAAAAFELSNGIELVFGG